MWYQLALEKTIEVCNPIRNIIPKWAAYVLWDISNQTYQTFWLQSFSRPIMGYGTGNMCHKRKFLDLGFLDYYIPIEGSTPKQYLKSSVVRIDIRVIQDKIDNFIVCISVYDPQSTDKWRDWYWTQPASNQDFIRVFFQIYCPSSNTMERVSGWANGRSGSSGLVF